MGVLSGLNTAALIYGPLVVIYKGARLQHQQRSIMIAAVLCAISEVIKMTLVAALSVSSGSIATSAIAAQYQDSLPYLVSLVDVMMLHMALNDPKLRRFAGANDVEARTVTIPFGWSVGQSVLYRLLPLYYNATNIGFDMNVLYAAIVANLLLFSNFQICGALSNKGSNARAIVLYVAVAAPAAVIPSVLGLSATEGLTSVIIAAISAALLFVLKQL